MDSVLARIRRTSKLGYLGETLAEEALRKHGFQVRNLNITNHNQPYADLLAEKTGQRWFIGVKARNEERDIGRLNESYNCVLVSGSKNRMLKAAGFTADQITELALAQVHELAASFDAIPAWIAVPIRPASGAYAAYFGSLGELGNRRSIPMTVGARAKYRCLMDWTVDPRITADLTNRRSVGNETAIYFAERRARANPTAFEDILKRRVGVPPGPDDEQIKSPGRKRQ